MKQTLQRVQQILIIITLLVYGAWAQDHHTDHSGHGHDAPAAQGKHIDEKDHDEKDHDDHDDHEEVAKHDDQKDDDHEELAKPLDDGDDHTGHGHDEAEEAEEGVITVTEIGKSMINLQLAHVSTRAIHKTIEIPGEVTLNQDKVAHVTPRFSGIIESIKKQYGEYVYKGDVLAIVENNETFTTYKVTAPISGRIIEKHATVGEFASGENSMFVIADLSTVWVNLNIFPSQLELLKVGHSVVIQTVGIDRKAEGRIEYISSVLDVQSRTATARVTLRNKNNNWRPGTFVHGNIELTANEKVLVVENGALQVLDGETVVFVPFAKGFKPIPVEVGVKGSSYTQIMNGLIDGEAYVSVGAFDLKAAVVTSSLSGHAGHGH